MSVLVLNHPRELSDLVGRTFPGINRFVIKVNWSSCSPGSYTDPVVLDWVLPALDGERIVVEGHSYGRRRGPVPRGAGREWFLEQERAFLADTGIGRTLKRHGARYVNVSEEIWEGRIVPADDMKELVRVRFDPLHRDEFYGFMPSVLFRDRERTLLLDLTRAKHSRDGLAWSLALKNLFGLIPDILRERYHPRMPEAILDIARLYLAAFPVLGIIETLEHRVVYCPGGPHSTGWTRYGLEDGGGLVMAGTDLLELELAAAARLGLDLSGRTLIRLARQLL